MTLKNFMKSVKSYLKKDDPKNKKDKSKSVNQDETPRSQFSHTMPLLLTGNHRIKKHRIPLIPTADNEIFKALHQFGVDYAVLSPKCILIQNFDVSWYRHLCNSNIGHKIQSKIKPINHTPKQFIYWMHNLNKAGFTLKGVSYIDGKGVHSEFVNKKHKKFNDRDLSKYKDNLSYQFALFANQKPPYNQLAINLDGTIYNFVQKSQPNYDNTISFVKALIKYQL